MKTQKMDGLIQGQSEVFLITLKTSNSDLGLNGEVEKCFAFIYQVSESHALWETGTCKRNRRMNLCALDRHGRAALDFLKRIELLLYRGQPRWALDFPVAPPVS